MYRLLVCFALLLSLVFCQDDQAPGTVYYTPGPCPTSEVVNCNYNSNNLNFDCSIGDFHISVTGNQNVPKYTIWDAAGNGTQYKFQITTSYEGTWDGDQVKKAGGTNIGMASLSWNFSDVQTILEEFTYCELYNVTADYCVQNGTYCRSEAQFNITNSGNPGTQWDEFIIVNHLGLGNQSSIPETTYYADGIYYQLDDDDSDSDTDDDEETSSTAVKMDFIATNYQWKTSGDSVVFAFECSFIEQGTDSGSNPDDDSDNDNDNDSDTNDSNDTASVSSDSDSQSASFNNGFFSVSSQASASFGNESVSVTVNLTQSGNSLQIVYSHFPSGYSLVHDPSLGVNPTNSQTGTGSGSGSETGTNTNTNTNTNTDNTNLTPLWITLGVIGGVFVVATVVGAGAFFVLRKRRATYTSV